MDSIFLALKDEKAVERDSLVLAAHLNQAMCCLKLNDFVTTRDHCKKALEIDSKNEKGLFRLGQVNQSTILNWFSNMSILFWILGQALLGIHEPEEAKKNFEAILTFDPNNKAAANQVVICNAKIREQREKDKKLYSSIFNKMAENDRQVNEKNGGKWRYGWWDEVGKGVQLDVNLEQIEREKQEAIEEVKANRRKDNEEFLKRYGGKLKPPKPVEVNGKPFELKPEEEEEVVIKSDQADQPATESRKFREAFSARHSGMNLATWMPLINSRL